jgi:uncharacterized membrane protein YidH (DUF202 family)
MSEEERTELARERTWLSYARTSMSFLVAGVALVKLFPNDVVIDAFAIFLGVFAFGFGWRAFQHIPKPHFLRRPPHL